METKQPEQTDPQMKIHEEICESARETARQREKLISEVAPWASKPPEIRSGEWVEELEVALRHAQAARDGIEKRDGNGTHTYGLNGAIVLLTLAYETERSRSSTVRTQPPR